MKIEDRIDTLEQQLYIAYSDANYQVAGRLERQIETLRNKGHIKARDDVYQHPYEHMMDDEWS